MHDWITNFALVFMALSLCGGLIRVVRGPTRADRMLSAQLFGSCGVALLVLLAKSMDMPSLLDAALVLALLAAIASFTFGRVVWGYRESKSRAIDALR